MNNISKTIALVVAAFCGMATQAQEKIVKPDIFYMGTPRTCHIANITIGGVEGYEDYMLLAISGLSKGQTITVPGSEVTDAVKRYWKHGLFSEVAIAADSIVGDSIYLNIRLALRPRVSTINYSGLKKSEQEDMENKLGLLKGGQVTPNILDRARILAKKYFDDKGFKNAVISIRQRDDVANKNSVILDIDIDKKQKMKVRNINIEGNKKLKTSKIKGTLFTKGTFKNLHEAGKLSSFMKKKKFTPERWKEDKEHLLDKYNELGYRDAVILSDSVWNADEKHVNVYVKVGEGKKYFIRNINWVGNTVYSTDYLSAVLGMKKGDVYNQRLLDKRLVEDEDGVGNNYWNNGYVFYSLQPTETNIVGDSIDLEMRIFEGQQAHINKVRINGNDRLYENVVRRELRVKPGDLFSKDALMRSARELASMGHFNQEKVSPDVKTNPEDGTVDINWNLEQKTNDQVEASLGWGQTGLIGRIGLKLNNFSMANIFGKNKERRGIMPIGDGEVLSLGAQSNARYYHSFNLGYSTAWFGGKRPIQFSVSAYYSKSTAVSDRYYNNAALNNYYYNMYGYSQYNGYNNYENYYDPDKYIQVYGASVGWGKRLRWPDDYFVLSVNANYSRYVMKNWQYLMITNGASNNLNFSVALNRTSTDNQLFPRRGSDFSASVTFTPPWSLWDGRDYKNLATNRRSATYEKEAKEKYKWVEYHKWKFKGRTYTALSGGQKCFVLMTRVEFGILGAYNQHKKSPFETFYVGGDGMSGMSYGLSDETIGMRGYENGVLSTNAFYTASKEEQERSSMSFNAYAYDRFSLELRYPFMLGNTTIYGLGFLEAGNAWLSPRKFNPFDMKRSAGIGVRIFLPMIGMMGLDWAYGFDKVNDGRDVKKGGSQLHFIIGQEF